MKVFALLLCLFAITSAQLLPDIYDYVIIGGGGAGSAMASRLSEDPTKTVLVLNRGNDDLCTVCDNTIEVNTPDGSIINRGLYTRNGADYFSTSSLFTGRSIREVRTNLPGGATRLYGGVSIPSAKALIDKKWPISYETLRPYFNKWQDHYCNYFNQTVTGISPADCATYHGSIGGPMTVSPPVPSSEFNFARDLFAAAPQVNITPVPDPFNPAYQHGDYVFPQASFQNRAVKSDIFSARSRESTWTGYLPANVRSRPNLVYKWQAEARRLVFVKDLTLFDLNRIYFLNIKTNPLQVAGVRYMVGDQMYTVYARRHVVLSGGVEGSVKFLQHNGIGPAALLAANNITLIANNRYIGQQVTTHAAVSMAFRTKSYLRTRDNAGKFTVMQLSSPTSEGWPDVEVEVYAGYAVQSIDPALTGTEEIYFTEPAVNGSYPFVSTFVEVTDPSARGSINITGPRFESPSQVNYGWSSGDYATSSDFQKLRWGFGRVRELFTGNNSFSTKWIDSELSPGQSPDPATQFSKDLFYSARYQHSIYHTTGGVNLGLATDNFGLVNGVAGLTVCDNSLLPYVPNANPTATMLALCEYVAAKVKTY